MSKNELSFFDEKRGIIPAKTEWGQWWQTVQEVHIQITLPINTKAKNIQVKVKPKHIEVVIHGKLLFEGPLVRTVYSEETIWTIEDNNLCIVLSKADPSVKDDVWESLLADGRFQPDPLTLHEMRKTLDLERFQIENPGMDFSRAQLQKNYDVLPGWSKDRLAELEAKSEEHQSASSSEGT